MSRPVVTFVTGNKNKLRETISILGADFPWELQSKAVDLPELQGEPEAIAHEKCLLAAKEIQGPVLVEDTSLCFNALKGLPGPYIKWFLDKTGLEGLNNILVAYPDKSAYAQCIFAYANGPNDPSPQLFIGQTNGTIVPARGEHQFGWDPIFLPDGYNQTFGEMSRELKHTISHRSRALGKLREYLSQVGK